jgi:outer membrane protein, heavy metal efflux system
MSKLKYRIGVLIFVAWTLLTTGAATASAQHEHHDAHRHQQQKTIQKTKKSVSPKKKARSVNTIKPKSKTTIRRGKSTAPKKTTVTKPQTTRQRNHAGHGTNLKKNDVPDEQKTTEPQTVSHDGHSNHRKTSETKDSESKNNEIERRGEQNAGQKPSAPLSEHDHDQNSAENQKTDSLPDDLPQIPVGSSVITLKELEEMALQNNPTLKQADFSIRAAEGRRRQAGMFPNPVVGYMGEEFSVRNFSESSEHMFFVEQKIPLGGKLSKSRRVFAEEVKKREAEARAQQLRVLNSVRLLYFEALGAQRLLEIQKDLVKHAEESVEISAELFNVGLKDRPDQLKTEIARQRAAAEYLEAFNRYEAVWQKIGAMVGKPEMPPARVEGNLADVLSEVNAKELVENLLANSPEIRAAQADVERARAALRRARAEKVPDLYLRGGFGYNNERLEETFGNRKVGPEGFIEVGVTLPIFNRNQGGVQVAEAELAIAEREVERLKLALKTKFAERLRSYRTSLFLADRYRAQIVPKAKAAFEMYSVNYRNMQAGYPKVLETRREYLQAQLEYARSLTALQKTLVSLKGFLLDGGLNAAGETQSEETESEEFEINAENPVNEDPE